MISSTFDRTNNTTDANVRGDTTYEEIVNIFLSNDLLQTGLGELLVVEECGVGVHIRMSSLVDPPGVVVKLEVLMELSAPGLLDTVSWPEDLLGPGRSRERHLIHSLDSRTERGTDLNRMIQKYQKSIQMTPNGLNFPNFRNLAEVNNLVADYPEMFLVVRLASPGRGDL